LVDTDILIDASRGLSDAADFLNRLRRAKGIMLSEVAAMELIGGCRDGAQFRQVRAFLDGVTVAPLTEASSATAQRLMETHALADGLRVPDALIAASAMEHGGVLHTRNVRHFRAIRGLILEQPY
jgi:predicted nucleic acid-binding protein